MIKTNYPIAALKGYIHQQSNRCKNRTELVVYSVTNTDGFVKSEDYFNKKVFSNELANYKIVEPGNFAYNPSRINVGSIDYLRNETSVIVSPLYIVFKVNEELSPSYVLRYLKSSWGNVQIRSKTEGAVRDSLKFSGLEKIEIPLPPLDDQKRIAFLLGKVEALIAQRKNNLQELDTLLKSIFVEMFENSIAKSWPMYFVEDLAAPQKGSMRTGPFGSNLLHSEFSEKGDVAVLGIDNVVQNKFVWAEKRFINFDKYELIKNYTVFPSDILITIMGTVGRSAVVPADIPLSINTKHLAAITANKELVNPFFLSFAVHSSPSIVKQLQARTRGAIMSGLNLTIIKELQIQLPPLDLQNKFAAIVEKVEHIKSLYQNSLTELEDLYGALSQKAFKGELDLSKVPLPQDEHEPLIYEEQEVEPETPSATQNEYRRIYTVYADDNEDTDAASIKAEIEGALSAFINLQEPFAFDDLIEYLREYSGATQAVVHELAKTVQRFLKAGTLTQIFDVDKKTMLMQAAK